MGGSTQTLIDAVVMGLLIRKTTDEAYDWLEDMAANAYQWPTECLTSKKALGVHEVDNISVVTTQLTILTKQLKIWVMQW